MNIIRTVARNSSNRLKSCWLRVICCICQSNEFEREIKHKTGGASRGPAKNLGGPAPPLVPRLISRSLLFSTSTVLTWLWLCFLSERKRRWCVQSTADSVGTRYGPVLHWKDHRTLMKDTLSSNNRWFGSAYTALRFLYLIRNMVYFLASPTASSYYVILRSLKKHFMLMDIRPDKCLSSSIWYPNQQTILQKKNLVALV